MTLIKEAGAKRNLHERHIGFNKASARALDSKLTHVLTNGALEAPAKFTRHVCGVETHFVGDLIQRYVLRKPCMKHILNLS